MFKVRENATHGILEALSSSINRPLPCLVVLEVLDDVDLIKARCRDQEQSAL